MAEEEKIKGRARAFGADAFLDPDSPQYKTRKDEEARNDKFKGVEREITEKLTTGDAGKKVLAVNSAADAIMSALKENNPLSATTAIYKFAKLLDPAGAVRNEDSKMIADPGGPLGELAMLHNQILEKGALTDTSKKMMRKLLPSLVSSEYSSYAQVRDALVRSAEASGANPANIQFIKPLDFSQFKTPAEKFAEKAKAAGIKKEQAIAAWKARKGGR